MDQINPVYDLKLSSVGPGNVTGRGVSHEPTNMDLVMKLHYLRGVYFFKKKSVEGLTIPEIKKAMFSWLNHYYINCGRFGRRSDTRRPFIKCHDCGVRIIEAKCKIDIEEWLEKKDHYLHLHNRLVSNQVLGDPELAFSPLVLIQYLILTENPFYISRSINAAFICDLIIPVDLSPIVRCNHERVLHESANIELTHSLRYSRFSRQRGVFSNIVQNIELTWFKCGGMSVGLSWAHVLGDAFSASDFINMWGHVMTGHPLPGHPLKPRGQTQVLKDPKTHYLEPLAIKRVDPVGDYWISTANNCKMGTYSFQINATQLEDIQTKINGKGRNQDRRIPSFEALSALLWQSLAKTSEKELEPQIITVCKRGSCDKRNGYSGNNQIVSTVKVDFSISKVNVIDLTELIIDRAVQENNQIEQVMEKDDGVSDFIIYGVNLTFVDLEEADVYGLVLKDEHKPVFVNYSIDGIGDNGVVLVLPGPSHGGRTVTVILPEDQVLQLRTELQREWCIT